MTEQTPFYELGQFLSAYFNQDWMHIKIRPDWTPKNADAASVVRYFIDQSPPELLKKVAEDIDELLTVGMSEEELQQFLYAKLGSYYMPTADGVSPSDWLRSVRELFLSAVERTPL
jgi:hypothetical protein